MTEYKKPPAKVFRSLGALCLVATVMLYCSAVFYPRYKMAEGNATLSWDATGYYAYLPALFIYKDVRQLAWADSIIRRYKPGPQNAEELGERMSNGHIVLKYSSGLALAETPFFFLAHMLARPIGYPQDGFSRPYQVAIQFGALLISFLGLWLLRRFLLAYYGDGIVAAVLLILGIGSNYLNYSAIDGGLSHTWLFTLYAGLLLATRGFYQHPSWKKALLIGALCGWAIIIRPTEIIAPLIPLLWGLETLTIASIKQHFSFLMAQRGKLALAVVAAAAIAMIQAFYWKITSGHWLFYSYGKQGFSWLHPHVLAYTFSYRSGWLTYTPVMVLAVVGAIPFLRYGSARVAISVCALLAFYIVTAWDIWWYAGTGGRAMIQYYPLLAMPLAAMLQWLGRHRLRAWASAPLILALCYINIWFTYQAHAGKLYDAEGNMTKEYFQRVIGRWSVPEETVALRDGRYLYESGLPATARLIYSNSLHGYNADSEDTMLHINTPDAASPEFVVPFPAGNVKWLRASATFHCGLKEWTYWKMLQFVISIRKGGKTVDENMARVHRLINNGETKSISVDLKLQPQTDADSIYIRFWNAGSTENIQIERLELRAF